MAFQFSVDILPPKCAIRFEMIEGEFYAYAERLTDDYETVILRSNPFGPLDITTNVDLVWANFEWSD
jgi:hypothetical protein